MLAQVIEPSPKSVARLFGRISDSHEMSSSGMRHGECPCYCSRCECWCECSDCRRGRSGGAHSLEALNRLWS
jgi:hypothetical protein